MNTLSAGLGRRKILTVMLALVVCAAVGLGVYLLTRDDLVIEQYAGGPPGAGGDGTEPTAVVMMDEKTIHVTTMGSSSCPAVPVDVTIIDGVVVVSVDSDSAGACTADLAPTTSVIELPHEFRGSDVAPTVRVE